MSNNKKSKKAYDKMVNFDPRGSNCPICKAPFRKGCDHSVEEADRRLFEDYIKSLQQK